jgi:hypothetical protein
MTQLTRGEKPDVKVTIKGASGPGPACNHRDQYADAQALSVHTRP